MANRAPAVAPPAKRPPRITILNANDVLLGRRGPTKYVGNERFHELIQARRSEYVSIDSYKEKGRIGEEIFDEISSRGGRFLKFVSNGSAGEIYGVWEEAPRKVALEKCKQALREIKKPKVTRNAKRPVSYEHDVPPNPNSSLLVASNTSSSVSPNVLLPVAFGVVRDPQLLLYEPNIFQQYTHFMSQTVVSPGRPLLWDTSHLHPNAAFVPSALSPRATIRGVSTEPRHKERHNEESPAEEDTELLIETELDREAAIFALSALPVSDRPRFTKEQERLEQSTMSSDERVAALCDLFGRCSVAGAHERKRARKDLDRESIQFLVGQMWVEIESMPREEKRALVEAKAKCQSHEFSDERLERFLRVVGLNPKAAAERFVCYWQCRRELFGEDKFSLPMTLTGALRDDITALEAGVYRVLPHPDSWGRQVVILEPRRNTGEGYTQDSLVRAIWYSIEVLAQSCTDIRSGFVYIGWNGSSSISDIANRVFGVLSKYEKTCWPVKFVAAHICGSSSLVLRIIMPIINALTDRRGRSRMVIHDVPDSELLRVLSDYGIAPSILPKEMGGSLVFDQHEWIANRYALELEEIK